MDVFGGTHGYIMTFIIGLVVGIIAKFLMPGRDPGGFIITAILGIVGSFVATWIGQSYRAGIRRVNRPDGSSRSSARSSCF